MSGAERTPAWNLSDLLHGLVADSDRYAGIAVNDLALDSRQVSQGSVFVALKGNEQHGLEFAEKAIEQGAVALLWEADPAWEKKTFAVPAVAINNLREKLGVIADRFFGQPSRQVNVVGVTGTDGKSTVSHFVADALNACGKKAAVIGTLGVGIPGQLVSTGLTTPDVISVHRTLADFARQGIAFAIMEVSSHALDQQRVAGVRFTVAVLTNLSRDHLDYHKTLQAYAAAKEKLFAWDSLKAAVVNVDDAFGQQLVNKVLNKQASTRLITYQFATIADPDSMCGGGIECLQATNPHYLANGIQTDIVYQSATDDSTKKSVSAQVLGEFNIYNLLAATGCLMAIDLSFEQAIDCVQQVKAVPGRMEKVSTDNQALVVVDYAHTPGALKAALQATRVHTSHRLVCVLGCGGDRDRGKRPQMAKIAEQYADMVVLTDDNPRSEMPFQIMHDMIEGLEKPEHVAVEHDRRKAIRFAVNAVLPGDAVLIAGKGHETVQIVGNEKLPFDDRLEAAAALRECAA